MGKLSKEEMARFQGAAWALRMVEEKGLLASDMDGQMSIFDFMGDFGNMTLKEIADAIGWRVGITFTQKGNEYQWKRKRMTISISLDSYFMSCQNFIDVSWSHGTDGGGYPCDTIDIAAEHIRMIMDRYKEK